MNIRDHYSLSKWADVAELKGNMTVKSPITSLVGSPKRITGDFIIRAAIVNCVGGPEIVDNQYYIGPESKDSLVNLDGIAKQASSLSISNCKSLESIDALEQCQIKTMFFYGCRNVERWSPIPKLVTHISLANCGLSNFNNLVLSMTQPNSKIELYYNSISSLENINRSFPLVNGVILLGQNPIKEGWLHLFLIKELKSVMFDNKHKTAQDIINQWLPMGKAGLVKCQIELIQAGLDHYARM